METHWENPKQFVVAIIPARYGSTRLEGKLLLEIAGQPLIVHTARRAAAARSVDRVIVATDDHKIYESCIAAGFDSQMTASAHESGSDRIAEVAKSLDIETLIVNVQGDEPLISPDVIDKAIAILSNDKTVDFVTTCEKIISTDDLLDPNIVKVVLDEYSNAIYFSRSVIPFPRVASNEPGGLEGLFAREPNLLGRYRKHTGLYVYRNEALLKFTSMKAGMLERIEMLEQLRLIENGEKIRVVEVEESSIGVDTLADFERVKRIIEAKET